MTDVSDTEINIRNCLGEDLESVTNELVTAGNEILSTRDITKDAYAPDGLGGKTLYVITYKVKDPE